MSVDDMGNADAQQLLVRASDLMFEALLLLDRTQTAHVAALLDHAIASLPACALGMQAGYTAPKSEFYSDKRSSIRR